MSCSLTRGMILGVAFAGVLLACTFTRSLDYLTAGGPDGGPGGLTDTGGTSSGGDGPAVIKPTDGFVKAQFNPQNLTQDADSIYWSTGDSAIMAAPKATGVARKVASAPPGTPITWLAADPSNSPSGFIYVVAGSSVERVQKDANNGALTLVEKDVVKPAAVVVDDTNIFVAHSDENSCMTGNVARFAKDGTGRNVLSIEGDDPPSVAIHGSSVFWAGTDTNAIGVFFELPKNAGADAGGAATVHRSASQDIFADGAAAFAVDADAIYYFETPRVMRLGRQGSPPATIVFETRTGVDFVSFVIDETSAYIAELKADGSIIRAPKMGGLPTPMAANQTAPTSIIVDAEHVYYAVEGTKTGPDGAIVRLPKK